MSPRVSCPACRTSILPDELLCPACGLLLQGEEIRQRAALPSRSSIIRAMLSSRILTGSEGIPPPPPPCMGPMGPTALFTPIPADVVPRLRVELGTAQHKLHEFEAHVASFIDGEHTLAALAQAAQLAEVEVSTVVRRLCELKMARLELRPKAPARPPPPPKQTAETRRRTGLPTITAAPVEELHGAARHNTPPGTVVARQRGMRPSSPLIPPFAPQETRAGPRAETRVEPRAKPQAESPALPQAQSPVQPQAESHAGPHEQPQAEAISLPTSARAEQSPEAREAIEEAVRLERSGQVEEAIEVLARAIAKVKAPAPLYNRLAIILLYQRQDFRRAARLLELALQLEPGDSVCQKNLQQVRAMERESQAQRQGKPWSLLARSS